MAKPLRRLTGFALLALLAGGVEAASGQAGPGFSATGPDAEAYGAGQGYPTGTPAEANLQRFMVGSYSHFDRVIPRAVRIARPEIASALGRAAQPIEPLYDYQGTTRTIEAYLDHNPVTGLLVARAGKDGGGEVLFEQYRYARTDADRFLSQSMAKTLTALLVGIAVDEGAIRSIDELAEAYVPELMGTEYGGTPIRALLHMSSGVAYHEVYDGNDDSARLNRGLIAAGPFAAVKQFNIRDAAPGTRFYYAGAETEVLSLVLAAAIHGRVADYLQSRIWQPLGAEADATWITDGTGHPLGYCCFNAILRDWARVGLMLARDGAWNGRQIVPRQWVLDATTVSPDGAYLAPGRATRFLGYGYQTWLFTGDRRQFALLGIHGQSIFIDPPSGLVMVQTAVQVPPTGGRGETVALWKALVRSYGD